MAIAGISVFKYQAQRFEVIAPLGVLIVSAVFYLTVALVNISFAVAAI